jgi:hypothetical protein
LVESQFTSILVLNFVILAAAITAFVILRRVAPVFYAPVLRPEYRYNWPEADAVWPNNEPPIPPPDTLFGWIPHVWRYSLDRMLGSHGLDAVVALAFLKLSFQQFLVAAAYGIVVLLPIHIFSPIPDPQDGLLRLTMANIENGSSLLWFHVVGIYVYSFVTYYAMFNLYRKYAAWRIHVMQRTMASNYTVLVRSLPRRTPKGAPFGDHHLRHMFEFLYPGEIVSARVVRHMPKTAKLRAERLEAARQLERAASQIGIDQGALEFGGSGYPPEALAAWKKRAASASRMSVKINKRLGLFGGERVDAIRHWRGEVERIGDEIQKSSALEVRNLTGNALVTFTSIQRAAQVKQLLFERRTFKFHVGPAPTPRDLLWLQFNLSPLMIRVRVLLVTVVVLLLTFFWAIPIAFVTGVVRLDSLARIFVSIGLPEVADAISDIPVALSGFLTSVVPVLIVSVFLSLVPAILRVLVRLEGAVSYNEVEKTVMDRYHTFILVNVFVTATLSGAIVDILSFVKEIADNPTLLATLLGTAVPAQAFFFTFYVAQAAIGALVLEVLRITGLIKGYVLRFLAKSARDYRDAFAPGPPPHAEALARHMLFFTINLTFSIATPLILPFSVMYYALGYLFDKYNLLYVYVPVAHGNGVMFESIITRSFVGLAIFQVSVTFLLFLSFVSGSLFCTCFSNASVVHKCREIQFFFVCSLVLF